MGFARSSAPHVIKSEFVSRNQILRDEAEAWNAFFAGGEVREADPFGVDDPCEFSPTGQHAAIGSCGDVVCCHCSRVFWS